MWSSSVWQPRSLRYVDVLKHESWDVARCRELLFSDFTLDGMFGVKLVLSFGLCFDIKLGRNWSVPSASANYTQVGT